MAAIWLGVTPSPASAKTPQAGFDIPAAEIGAMLDVLARQSGRNILYNPENVRGRRGEAVRKVSTVAQALALILRESGLEASYDRSGAIAIVPRQKPTTPHHFVDQDIVVTGTRRDTSLSAVPDNIKAISGSTLESTNRQRMSDYARTIPGLTFIDEGGRDGLRPALRGLRSGTDIGLVSTTAVYVDDVNVDRPVTFRPLDLKILDIERIEILRGPQGTLYGSGAIGGVIRYISKKPDMLKSSGRMKALSQAVQGGSANYELSGSVNLPILADKAALRLAAGYFRNGGYIDNIALNDSNVNDEATLSIRAAIRLQPSEDLTVDLSAYRQRSHYGERSWYESGLGHDTVNHPNAGWLSELASLAAINIEHNFDFAKLVLTSSVFDIVRSESQDLTYSRRDRIYAQRIGQSFPLPDFTVYNSGDEIARSWAHEIRLTSDTNKKFDWIFGGYYYKYNHHNNFNLFSPTPFEDQEAIESFLETRIADDHFSFNQGRERFRHYAFFGELGYRITPAWRASLGVRHYNFHRRQRRIVIDLWNPLHRTEEGQAVIDPLPNDISLGRYDEHGESYRFNTSYDLPRERGIAYFTAAQGVRPGGYNVETAASPIPEGYKQFNADKIWSYEIGGRLNLSTGIQISGAAYQIDWRGMQTQVQLPTLNGLRANAGRARSKGLELELSTLDRAMPGLSTSFGFSYTDVRLKERVNGIGFAGERAPFVPRFTGSMLFDYTFPISGAQAGLDLGITFTGQTNSDFGPSLPGATANVPNPQFSRLDEYWLTGVGFRLEFNNYVMRLAAENLFNVRATTYSVYQPSYSSYRQSFHQITEVRPRAIGIDVSRTF